MPLPAGVTNNMGYPSTVDSGLVIPWTMQADDRFNATATSTTTLAITTTYISAVTWTAFGILTGFRYRCGTGGTDSCDIGLYDASGNLLTHTGSTLTSGSASGTTINLATAYSLSPQRYYLAFWMSGATNTIRQFSLANGVSMSSFANTGGTSLPTTITPPLGSLGVGVCVDGLISGGWS